MRERSGQRGPQGVSATLLRFALWLLIVAPGLAQALALEGWWRSAEPGESIEQVALDDPRWQRFDPSRLNRLTDPQQPPDQRVSWILLRPAADAAWPDGASVLRVRQGVLQWLTLYLPDELPRSARLLNPEQSGELAHGLVAWRLDGLAGSREPVIFMLDARNRLSSSLRFELSTLQAHRAQDARWLAYASAMLSVMLSMGLMALVFAVYLRDLSFVYYAGYNVSYAGILMLQTGFAASPLGIAFDPELAPISGRLFTAASVCFAVLFLDRFADLRRYARRGRWLLIALGGGVILASSLSLLPSTDIANLGRALTNPFLIIGGPAVVGVALAAAWAGSRYARIFLIGWVPLLAVTSMGSLQLFGLFQDWHWLGDAALGVGALEALVLSLGLARRSLDLRRERDAVRALADLDPLTGLMNRRAWRRRMDALDSSLGGVPLSLLFIDVDHFKTINDRFGHAVGDAVLTRLAAQLRAELRGRDLLARYGGEELVAALPDCSPQRAQLIAERLRAQVAGIDFSPATEIDHEPLRLSISIGVSSLHPGESIDALLARADEAMYQAKAAGRDRVVVVD